MLDRRETYRQGLHTFYLPVYNRLCEGLSESWQPYYGKRAMSLQDELFAIGRTAPGRIVTNARGGESPHNYGCASDWTWWENGKPIWMSSRDKRWGEYRAACEKAGAKWGGYFKNADCFHNELPLRVSWKRVGEVYFSQGLLAATNYVGEQKEAIT